MAEWQRLSVRDGRRPPVKLSEGFSEPATVALLHWLEGAFGYRDARGGVREKMILDVALAAQVTIYPDNYDVRPLRQLLNNAARDDDLMLDILDAVLHARVLHESTVEALRRTLRDAYSVWTVSLAGTSLERRVEEAAHNAYKNTVMQGGAAATHLEEAWSQLYGIAPNPSDAWDHAIKAIETALVPIVAPRNPRATLGTVIAELKKDPAGVTFRLGSNPELSQALRFAWPNPDRHGGGAHRAPTEGEAAGVVQFAIAVVEWERHAVISAAAPTPESPA